MQETAEAPDNVVPLFPIGAGADLDTKKRKPRQARPHLPALALNAGRIGAGLALVLALYLTFVTAWNLAHSGLPVPVVAAIYAAVVGAVARLARGYGAAINIARTKWGSFTRWTETLD